MPSHPLSCPVCATPMKKVTVAGGVQIDVCDSHGAWLDAGELQAIIDFHERQATPTQPRGGSGAVGRLSRNLASGVAHGAGFGAGTAIARSLIHRLLG